MRIDLSNPLRRKGSNVTVHQVGTSHPGTGIGCWLIVWLSLTIPTDRLFSAEPFFAAEPDAGQPPRLLEHDNLVDRVQEKVVKIFGAGGGRGLESYQTGIWVGNEGHILTTWSTVLDVGKLRIVTSDGRKFDSNIVSFDPFNELALLKVDDANIQGFVVDPKASCRVGQRVFAVSNLFKIATGDEYCSVQKGVVMALAPLAQRRGTTKTLTQGRVYILDVMTNNPGASGGALIDLQGRLVGVLGKEIRDADAGIWVNYALPMDVVNAAMERMISGAAATTTDTMKVADKPHKLGDLGLTLIPDVLPKTPVFIDEIRRGSLADLAGLRSNDLILLLNDQRIDSRRSFEKLLSGLNRADSFELLIQRGEELIRIQIRP
jgi:S1-C subfamily serine protease